MAYSGRNSVLVLLFASFALIVPSLRANIVEYDDYWEKRAEEARNATLEAYHPYPEQVTSHLNVHVHMALSGSNSTRRSLKARKYNGPCVATNPIDQCWRCDPKWARNRKRLAHCGLGFGRRTVGGKAGRYYVVTDPSDNDVLNPRPGTLRHAVIQREPLWIIFARSMVIKLCQELIVQCDKTIDGRGANILITGGAGITIQYAKNIIIHGIRIHKVNRAPGGLIRDAVDHFGFRMPSEGDGIAIFGSSLIWIDHVSMSRCQDGLIDAVAGSTAITVSNCHFTHHDHAMLFGGNNMFLPDEKMQITLAFNHFGKGMTQRMPRVRFGFVHVVNNDYTHWKMYAIGGSQHPTIISQGNRFRAPPYNPLADARQVTKREYAPESEWKHWLWISECDQMMDGAFFVASGDPGARLRFSKKDIIKAMPGKHVGHLTRFSGSLNCKVGRPC